MLKQSDHKKPYTLRVREHPETGPYVQGERCKFQVNVNQVFRYLYICSWPDPNCFCSSAVTLFKYFAAHMDIYVILKALPLLFQCLHILHSSVCLSRYRSCISHSILLSCFLLFRIQFNQEIRQDQLKTDQLKTPCISVLGISILVS